MKNVTKVNLYFILIFFGDALFSPFFALYFIHLGYTDIQLGILLAIKPACTIIGNFVYGKLSGNMKRNLLLIKILSVVNLLCMFLFAFCSNFAFAVILMAIWSLHNSATFSIADGIAVNYCEKENKIYSITRMLGSTGYCLALILGGILGICNKLNYQWIFISAAAIFQVAIVFLILLKPFDNDVEKKEKVSYKRLFTNKSFIKYIIFYFFVIGVWRIADDYCSHFFNSLGLNDGQWSFLFAGEVIVEIITIYIVNKLVKKQFNYVYILICGSSLMMVRSFLFALPIGVIPLVISTGILRGVSWGLFLASHMQIVKQMLGAKSAFKAVTFLAVEVSIFSTIGNYFYLPIANMITEKNEYAIFGFLQLIGIIVLLTIDFSFMKQEKSSGTECIK